MDIRYDLKCNSDVFDPLHRNALVAAEASAAAVAAVSVHGTGTALGALAVVLHRTTLMQH